MSKPPTMAPAPASLAAALASVGLDVELAVTRQDGAPLTDDDRAAVEALVACHDVEIGREISDDDVAFAVASSGSSETTSPTEEEILALLEDIERSGNTILTEEGMKEIRKSFKSKGDVKKLKNFADLKRLLESSSQRRKDLSDTPKEAVG